MGHGFTLFYDIQEHFRLRTARDLINKALFHRYFYGRLRNNGRIIKDDGAVENKSTAHAFYRRRNENLATGKITADAGKIKGPVIAHGFSAINGYGQR